MNMRNSQRFGFAIGAVAMALASIPASAQQQPYPPQTPPQQYPPQQQQQYPPQQQQYPPQQYPPQQYPAQQQPYYSGNAPAFSPDQLDQMVSRIALYPDPLLAQVLTAATFPDQVPQAASWAMAHQYLTGDQLARAINDDRLPWDPSVLGLLPFPSVLDTMARDQQWTQNLGAAVLADRGGVMDAVQRMRQRAYDYGYLQNTPQERVVREGPGYIQIMPVESGYYYVPTYDPRVVFYRPRRGAFLGINFGPRVFVGASFAPWGWRNPGFDWRAHNVIIDNRPWDRRWQNRTVYAHPYAAPIRRPERIESRPVERHEREVREHSRGGERHDEHDRDRDHDRR
jgi:hypothetical protein